MFHEFVIHPAPFVVVVLHLRLREAHKTERDAGFAVAVRFVCYGHHMPNAGVGVLMVEFGETAVVDRQHIDFHGAGRRIGILGVRACQFLVEVAHTIAVRIGQVVQVADVQSRPQRKRYGFAHADTALPDPTTALILLQDQR